MKFKVLILFGLGLNVLAAAQQQGTTVASIKQKAEGPCAITIGVVNGRVTVNCPGVNPNVIKTFTRELEHRHLSEQELLKQLEELRKQHIQLLESLASSNVQGALELKARDLVSRGEFTEAQKILDSIIEQGQPELKKLAERHIFRARLFDLRLKKNEALQDYRAAYQYYPQNPDHILMYGNALIENNEYLQAEPILEAAIDTYRRKASKEVDNKLGIALTLNSLGVVYRHTQRLTKAEEAYVAALSYYRELLSSNNKYLFEMLKTVDNLGSLCMITHKLRVAELAYLRLLPLYQNFVEHDRSRYLPYLARARTRLSYVYDELGDTIQSRQQLSKALAHYSELPSGYLEPYFIEVADVHRRMGLLHGRAYEFDEAEKHYFKALVRYMRVISKDPSFGTKVVSLLNNLGLLYSNKDANDKSKAAYIEALRQCEIREYDN